MVSRLNSIQYNQFVLFCLGALESHVGAVVIDFVSLVLLQALMVINNGYIQHLSLSSTFTAFS